MDPIRTAVKYSLIPLRTVVKLGESFVESGETPPPPRAPAATKRQKRTQPRKARRPARAPKALDDNALARKVETLIFIDPLVPQGQIDVSALDGVVWLRGEATSPEMVAALGSQTAGIPEVKRVENQLQSPAAAPVGPSGSGS